MTQPNPLQHIKQIKQKLQKFHWSVWFPYPSSWFRAFILVPIASLGAILIVLGFAGAIIFAGAITSAIGNNPVALIIFVLFGLLIPTIILSFPYYFFWFIWKKQQSSNRWPKWVPSSGSLWEGFYATVVMFSSFLAILAIVAALSSLSCISYSYETAVQLAGCRGSRAGRVVREIFNSIQNDDFRRQPWFVIWLIIAAYLYQVEYLVRRRFILG